MTGSFDMRIQIFTLFSMLFLLGSVANAQEEDPCGKINKKAAKTFEEAIGNYYQAQKFASAPSAADSYYKEANKLLLEVKEIDPEYAPTYYFLGCVNVFKKENNLELAEKHFKKAIDLCPDGLHDAYFQLGKIYFGQEKTDQAAVNFKAFLDKPELIEDDSVAVEAKILFDWSMEAVNLMNNPVPFDPVLVPGISSADDDYLVIISPDNEKAFYTRYLEFIDTRSSVPDDAQRKEFFYVSERKKQGVKAISELPFDNGEKMPAPFNSGKNEGGATITIDNKEMILTICAMPDKNNYRNCDLYYTKYAYGEWSDLIPLDAINRPDSWESQPSISSDGKTLYFASNRKGGSGRCDIYTSTRDESGSWSAPKNLGKAVNSKGDDKSPFIHTDSQTLYFSSDGRPGMGSFDIYYTRKKDDGEWEKPTNIGYPINTRYDDVGFFVSTDGKYGYFGSNNQSQGLGGYDFYSFALYAEARPEKVLFIKGTVTNNTDDAPIEAKVEIKNVETKEVMAVPVDVETGDYVAAMSFESDYVLTVKKPDFVYESTYISKEDTTFSAPVEVNVELEPVELGKAYRMKDIYYESNSADLTQESKKVLDEFLDFLVENPNIEVKIQGHTDNIGGEVANMTLSENRAHSVYNYLVSKGVSSSRLSYKGFGETKPVDTNDTEVGRAMNRRTEFLVTGM